MSIVKRLVILGIIIVGIAVVAVNFKTIRSRVVGYTENAAYMREAKEAGSKYMSDVFSNWSYDAFLASLDDSVRAQWNTPDKAQMFSLWNGTYGSITQKRVSVAMKQEQGENVDFDYRAEMQCSYKNALLVMTLHRKSENNWKIIDLKVSDLPDTAEKFQ